MFLWRKASTKAKEPRTHESLNAVLKADPFYPLISLDNSNRYTVLILFKDNCSHNKKATYLLNI